jgi:hypothetical protein
MHEGKNMGIMTTLTKPTAERPTPGVRVFDTVTDRDLIPGPLNVGQLPPRWVLFLE